MGEEKGIQVADPRGEATHARDFNKGRQSNAGNWRPVLFLQRRNNMRLCRENSPRIERPDSKTIISLVLTVAYHEGIMEIDVFVQFPSQ